MALFALGNGTPKLRLVTANLPGPSSVSSVAIAGATTTRVISRVYFSIGSGDISQWVLSFFSFYLQNSTGVTPLNGYTIESCAIEYAGQSKPVTFSGGRSAVIGAAASDIQADPLLASAFGSSVAAWGSTGYLRFILTFATPSTDQVAQSAPQSGTRSGASYLYNPSKVIVTNGVDGTGPITYSMTNGGVDGTDIVGLSFPFAPAVLGKFADYNNDPGSWIITGDSAGYGTGGAASAEGARGLSFAFYPDKTLPAGAKANWNICCNSGNADDWAGGTPSLLTNYLKYFKYALDEYGSNRLTIPGSTLIHAAMRTAGIRYIIKTSVQPRTSDATNRWEFESDQVIVGGWGPGSDADNFQIAFQTMLASDQGYIDFTGLRGVDYWKWKCDGLTNQWFTPDGLHPSDHGYDVKCTGTALVYTPSGVSTSSLQAMINGHP